MAKRILIFSLAYHPFIGGAEIAVKEITDRVPAQDIEFDMITLRFDSKLPKFERIGNVNVYRLGFTAAEPTMSDLVIFPLVVNKYLFPILAFWKAVKLHTKRSYDASWAVMANYAGFAAVFFKMRFPEVPMLLTLQEGDPIDYIKRRVRFVYPLFTRIFTKATSVQAISEYLAEFARSMAFRGPLEVIPNGVDIKRFSYQYSVKDLEHLRKSLNGAPDANYLIHTGRLVLKNGLDDILRSLPMLPGSTHLLLAGIGPDEDKLRNLSKELKVEDRVKFLGHISHEDLPKYLACADIFIRPSLSEGMGNSFIEAMAAGLPVIATPIGGIVDFLFDPERNPDKVPTGLFCEVRNPESIARQVERLMADAVLRERLTTNARTLVTQQYDWDLIATRMRTKVFAALLNNATRATLP